MSWRSKTSYTGIMLALAAAMLWGISGTCAQYVFVEKHIDPAWLVTMRLLVSGTLLLLFAASKKDSDLIRIWKNKRDTIQLLLFGIAGMFAIQYTYFAAIVTSNAATATVLQYTGPVFIAIYLAAVNRKLPVFVECMAIALALTGVFLLVTHGTINNLVISPLALFWGIASAFAAMLYSLLPVSLMKRYSTAVIIGWGMLLGGITSCFIGKPWIITGTWDMHTLLAVTFIILFGSLVAFYIFLLAIKQLGAQTASLLACTEPLAAILLAVVWLDVSFEWTDWAGTACILITIVLLSGGNKK